MSSLTTVFKGPKGKPVAIKVEKRPSVTCRFLELKFELKPRMLIPGPATPARTYSTPFKRANNSPGFPANSSNSRA